MTRGFIDLTGRRFGRLVVKERTGTTHFGKALWRCLCDCGAETTASGSNLRAGTTKSCGCMRRRYEDLTGRRFGRLLVLSEAGRYGTSRHRAWNCVCDCGAERTVMGGSLTGGHSTSCGCSRSEIVKAQNLRKRNVPA